MSYLSFPIAAPATFGTSPTNEEDERLLVCRWQLEHWLCRARWGTVALWLLLIPLFPGVSRPSTVAVALAVGIGNGCLSWLLHQERRPARLRLARRAATALEWASGFGGLLLFADEPTSRAPAALLLLMVIAGARYGLHGLMRATVAASLAVGTLVATQVLVLRVLDAPAARDALWGWLLLIALAALVAGGMARSGGVCCWEQAHWESHADVVHRATHGLTMRELTVLPWLARAELTYNEIGMALHISPKTVKAHVQHIGQKLGVSGDRWVVVEAARARGLLPSGRQLPGPTPDRDQPD